MYFLTVEVGLDTEHPLKTASNTRNKIVRFIIILFPQDTLLFPGALARPLGRAQVMFEGALPNGRASASSRIPKHREEMTDGSGDHKQMPGEVCVANSMSGEETNAGSVSHAAREQPR